MNWMYVFLILGILLISGFFNVVCVWIGYRAAKGESVYESKIEGQPVPLSEEYEDEDEEI